MAESIVVVISSASPQALGTALDLVAAAVALEMEAHVYFTSEAVVWVGQPGGEAPGPEDAGMIRRNVAGRLRELKGDGVVKVYACSGAMSAHGIAPERLAPEVDMPAGFAYILDLASRASVTLNF